MEYAPPKRHFSSRTGRPVGSLEISRISAAGRQLFDGLVEFSDGLITRLSQHKVVEAPGPRRLTIVHFGEYAKAFWWFKNGGEEEYYAAKYSVDFWASLAGRKDIESFTAISLSSDAAASVLPNGVHVVGIELYKKGVRPRYREVVEAIKQTRPSHLIVMSPIMPVIRWALRARIPLLPMFADSFRGGGLKAKIQYGLLAFLLNDPSIELVANHNLAASLDLERIGVDPKKIVPFDWPALLSPRDYEAKSAPPNDRPVRLIYVGSLIETKGVGDAIRAVSKLTNRGRQVQLTIIGRGEVERFNKLAIAEKVEDRVFIVGSKTHTEVLAAMREHDAVLVPSHWAYPEGLPMTLYEALCTRTPLLTSDHPMFALRIRDGHNALVFPERNPDAFADRIDELASSPDLYGRLSNAGESAAENYLCPLKYDRLISDFLTPSKRKKLLDFSLANYAYN
jgi:glycosyltransferase involved in cell wall biosynthesis